MKAIFLSGLQRIRAIRLPTIYLAISANFLWLLLNTHAEEAQKPISARQIIERLQPLEKSNIDQREIRSLVLKLGNMGDTNALPILKKYSERATLKHSWLVEGAAQVSLAKLGDNEAFQEVMREFSSDDPIVQSDAFKKMGMIGGKKAIKILAGYLGDFKSPKSKTPPPGAGPNGERAQGVLEFFPKAHLAAQALANAVSPRPTQTDPDFYSEDDIKKWSEWWAANKGKYED